MPKKLLADELPRAKNSATNVKNEAQLLKDRSAVNPVERETIVNFMGSLTNGDAIWSEIIGLPGLNQYAVTQYGSPGLQIEDEFAASSVLALDLRDWIENMVPKSGGAWLVNSYTNDGRSVDLMFTVAELADFVTKAGVLITQLDTIT